MLEHEVIDSLAGFEGFLGNLGGILVADNGVEGGNYADAVVNVAAAGFFVGCDAVNAEGA